MTRSLQEWVYWLDQGRGRGAVRLVAGVLGIVALSLIMGYKQFRGPLTERVMEQAAVGRQLASGAGFTTPVLYPQAVAHLDGRRAGVALESPECGPELYHAPLYSLVIGAGLKVLPTAWRERFFAKVPEAPEGFGGDYFLLGLNIVLFWVAAWQTYRLARGLFDRRVAWVALGGVVLSAPLWDHVVAVDGTAVLIVLALEFFRVALVLCRWPDAERAPVGWLGYLGVLMGLWFLADYSAGVLVGVVALGVWRLARGLRYAALVGLVAGGFLLVAAPWCVRNVAVAGHPLALGWQEWVQKKGDPAAEPSVARTMFSNVAPEADLRKLVNKGLTALQVTVRERFWSGGALVFAAFFLVGCLYRFRADGVLALRWFFVVTAAVLMAANAFADSGEGTVWPVVYLAPVMIIFGAGFFFVLMDSMQVTERGALWAGVGLLVCQALPLAHDLAEPRRI